MLLIQQLIEREVPPRIEGLELVAVLKVIVEQQLPHIQGRLLERRAERSSCYDLVAPLCDDGRSVRQVHFVLQHGVVPGGHLVHRLLAPTKFILSRALTTGLKLFVINFVSKG